jgi:hypothetical protein
MKSKNKQCDPQRTNKDRTIKKTTSTLTEADVIKWLKHQCTTIRNELTTDCSLTITTTQYIYDTQPEHEITIWIKNNNNNNNKDSLMISEKTNITSVMKTIRRKLGKINTPEEKRAIAAKLIAEAEAFDPKPKPFDPKPKLWKKLTHAIRKIKQTI